MLSWTPRTLPGGIYCSPACGAACKKADHDRAVKKSAALARHLGEGWAPRVWENMGWHWAVQKGVLSVHQRKDECFVVYMNGAQQFIAEGTSALGAVRTVIKMAQDRIKQIQAEISMADPG